MLEITLQTIDIGIREDHYEILVILLTILLLFINLEVGRYRKGHN